MADELFAAKPKNDAPASKAPWIIANAAVIIGISVAVFSGSRHKPAPSPHILRQPDAYAANLKLEDLAMGTVENMTTVKTTTLDGKVTNTGDKTLTAVDLQVIFATDGTMQPQIETERMQLVRTRLPALDLQSMSQTPLKPGETREFEVIFESITPNWNQQMPEVRVVGVSAK